MAAQGDLQNGGLVTHLTDLSSSTTSFAETLDFIQAQPDRKCVPVKGLPICADNQNAGIAVDLPARGAAIMMSDADFESISVELQTMCRIMGKNCTYQTQALIAGMKQTLQAKRVRGF